MIRGRLKMFEDVIKKMLSGKRYQHSLNVAESAQELATRFGLDPEKAKIAGELHDITKEFSPAEQIKLVNDHNIKLSEFEKKEIKILHPITGRVYIENVLKVNDPEILDAVRYHTTGRKGMGGIEKVLYIADSICADRVFRGVERLRELSKRDLDVSLMSVLCDTISNLSRVGRPIHPDTFEAYNEVAQKLRERKSGSKI